MAARTLLPIPSLSALRLPYFRTRLLALIALLWLQGGCMTAPRLPKQLAPGVGHDVIAALLGSWDNTEQYRTADEALKIPPTTAPGTDWLDQQYAEFYLVRVPALGEQVVYLEWRKSGPGGEISRQRLWSFRADPDGSLRMDFYAFKDGSAFAGRGVESAAFARLTVDDLRGYAPECALRFRREPDRWVGQVAPDECHIVAASGRRMGIDAHVELRDDDQLWYREAGVLDDGSYAFRVPPTQPYVFRRLPEPGT